jgi:OOP family OmpA-OmpF porin
MNTASRYLLLALPMAMAFSLPAKAQDYGSFDDRWYLTAGAGANISSDTRDAENSMFGTIGAGKFINPNWSVDVDLNYQNPHPNSNEDLNFSQYGVSVDARRHFRQVGRRINPYVVMGVGYERAEEEFDAFPSPNSPGRSKRGYATAKLGVGAQADFSRFSLRGEVAARRSFDNDSVVAPQASGFTDTLASLGVVIPLGVSHMVAQAVPAPVSMDTCSDLDDDGDGVNNCTDKCPQSQAGQAIGADGCPVPLTIDLKGVNFDFNSDNLTTQSRAVLDEAIAILGRYPDMKVEVAGHTDSIGSDGYNQDLSERRARAVYDYLTTGGVSSERLEGPIGYGETRPIAPNTNPDGSDNPEGRAQNRRTELNVEN